MRKTLSDIYVAENITRICIIECVSNSINSHVFIEKAAAKLKSANRVAILTGAGVSKESGIPTFRDAQTGLWANYRPEDLATPEGFLHNPDLVWQWYDSRRKKLLEVSPNPGHYAMAELEQFVPEVTVITQNVDGLHQQAGSKTVLELHGSITEFRCFAKGHPVNTDNIEFGLASPPTCHCGSPYRPGVVWFGESLPGDVLNKAQNLADSVDTFIVAGTSGIVQPAASLPFIAAEAGAFVIEINPEPTPITSAADIFLQGPSGEIWPKIIGLLKS